MTRLKLLTTVLTALCIPALAHASTLTVKVENIQKAEGAMYIGLYDAAGYGGTETKAGAIVTVEGESVTATFDDIAPGEYGIMLFQDLDGDGELDTGMMGIPSEPYAFSNNAKARFGPAKWKAARFAVSGDDASHTIRMK